VRVSEEVTSILVLMNIMAANKRTLFLGTFIHSKSLNELEYLHDTAICVDKRGVIVGIEKGVDEKKAEEILFAKLGWKRDDVEVKVARDGEFYFPGFIGIFFSLPTSHNSTLVAVRLTRDRYTYPRFTISQCRYIRENYFIGLVKYLHFPYGKQSFLYL